MIKQQDKSRTVQGDVGQQMYDLMARLFPICRSITGNGVRETLAIIQGHLSGLQIREVPSGTKVFDWIIPKEWNIRDAYILDEQGKKVVDFKKNNLHVVGYSVPVCQELSLAELQGHLYSLPDQPDAIPYVTSYYKEHWGFCMAHNQRAALVEGKYRVVIDSEHKDGHLVYGELISPGRTKQEVFLSTYICHPSMANNELSGPVVSTFLAKMLAEKPRRYTYRIIFIPETIGSITYLSQNLGKMKKNMVAGLNITCVGDDRTYSYLPSRDGNTLSDRAALNILNFQQPGFKRYSFLERGSDERQYCSPGVDLPVASIMRSKYGTYPEYHTSLDNLSLVSPRSLQDSFNVLRDYLELIEQNYKYKVTCYGEPQLGRRGLYPSSIGKSYGPGALKEQNDFIAYADGKRDLVEISDTIKVPADRLYPIIEKLLETGLIKQL